MCGRYTLIAPAAVATVFDTANALPQVDPTWNAAPGTRLPVVALERLDDGADGRRVQRLMWWGLQPRWEGDPRSRYSTINARSETLLSRSTWRESARSRRCLVPATGFYEWQRVPGQRQKVPYYIRARAGAHEHGNDDGLFGMAGIYDEWTNATTGELEQGFSIVTTSANDLVAQLHDRMPVILSPEDWTTWLDPAADVEDAMALLRPFASSAMRAGPVTTLVNNVANDGPELIAPAPEPGAAPGDQAVLFP